MELLTGIIALIIGFSVGWFLRGKQTLGATEPPDAGLSYKLQQRDEELRAARSEIAVHTATLDTLRNELAILTKKQHAGPSAQRKPATKPAAKRKATHAKKAVASHRKRR
ncbi:MAG: hypothetical protein KF749_17155 [Bacteroidetes bacterium]|nr:hypothetical protein [Bacteroidota bacterium]MCW5895757.1 hypothetical protein [Bacteroidota bacterium]